MKFPRVWLGYTQKCFQNRQLEFLQGGAGLSLLPCYDARACLRSDGTRVVPSRLLLRVGPLAPSPALAFPRPLDFGPLLRRSNSKEVLPCVRLTPVTHDGIQQSLIATDGIPVFPRSCYVIPRDFPRDGVTLRQ